MSYIICIGEQTKPVRKKVLTKKGDQKSKRTEHMDQLIKSPVNA